MTVESALTVYLQIQIKRHTNFITTQILLRNRTRARLEVRGLQRRKSDEAGDSDCPLVFSIRLGDSPDSGGLSAPRSLA